MKQSLYISTLVELADSLVNDFDVLDMLTMLSCRCAEVLDAAAAGVVLVTPTGNLQVVASSDESMQVLEVFQVQTKEGPSFDCYRSGLPVVRLSLEEARNRWPKFVPQALALGYKSVHCLPLRLRNETIGALNLFRSNRGEMDAEDVLLAQGLADIAAIAILQHRAAGEASALNGQLTTALGSRIVIEQAKGIVSQSEECSVEVAFGRIRAHSRNHNERLTEVAARTVAGHLEPSAMDPVGSSS